MAQYVKPLVKGFNTLAEFTLMDDLPEAAAQKGVALMAAASYLATLMAWCSDAVGVPVEQTKADVYRFVEVCLCDTTAKAATV
jgi:hypothetical protein